MITPGDTVILNSGGPLMTIRMMFTDDKGDTYAECCWTNNGTGLAFHTFNLLMLTIIDYEEKFLY